MPFPPVAPFNPPTTKVPILGPSSGNPKSYQDPNSIAMIGANIQAMTDQAKADTLYDTPRKLEGYQNMPWIIQSSACRREGFESVPWIVKTGACLREGFMNTTDEYYTKVATAVFIVMGISLAICYHK